MRQHLLEASVINRRVYFQDWIWQLLVLGLFFFKLLATLRPICTLLIISIVFQFKSSHALLSFEAFHDEDDFPENNRLFCLSSTLGLATQSQLRTSYSATTLTLCTSSVNLLFLSLKPRMKYAWHWGHYFSFQVIGISFILYSVWVTPFDRFWLGWKMWVYVMVNVVLPTEWLSGVAITLMLRFSLTL